jgi:hypothetical protein
MMDGIRMDVRTRAARQIRSSLVGQHNVMNLLGPLRVDSASTWTPTPSRRSLRPGARAIRAREAGSPSCRGPRDTPMAERVLVTRVVWAGRVGVVLAAAIATARPLMGRSPRAADQI